MTTILVKTMTIKNPSPTDLHPKTLIVVAGPTAIGKTEVAIRLARHFNTAILSADSRQFYRELQIGTAAPTAAEKARAPHHFSGHLSIHDSYNVSRFENDALQLLDQLFMNHDYVVMCGGSGLYIDAVCRGIDDIPGVDLKIRRQVDEAYRKQGISYLQNELARLDPEYFARVDKSNPNRMKRAIEVCITSGKTFSSFRLWEPHPRPFKIIKIGLNRPRHELFQNISKRTDQMMADGLVDEVKSLLPFRELNALNTVGYKEIFGYLDGEMTLDQAVEKIKTNTRRYARRQLTWFKKDKEIHWFMPENEQNIIHYIADTKSSYGN